MNEIAKSINSCQCLNSQQSSHATSEIETRIEVEATKAENVILKYRLEDSKEKQKDGCPVEVSNQARIRCSKRYCGKSSHMKD